MYESPINAYFGEVETQFDGAVFKAVQSVGIDVNKDELIKALAYDLTYGGSPPDANCDCVHVPAEACENCWLDWLKQEVEHE